jgi:hypothetical protein
LGFRALALPSISSSRARGGQSSPRRSRGQSDNAIGERYFATRWDDIAKRTGTGHLNRQDLRRTAVIRLSEASCTIPEIIAITGHSPKTAQTILDTYLVTTYEMARNAIAKLESHQTKRTKGAQN